MKKSDKNPFQIRRRTLSGIAGRITARIRLCSKKKHTTLTTPNPRFCNHFFFFIIFLCSFIHLTCALSVSLFLLSFASSQSSSPFFFFSLSSYHPFVFFFFIPDELPIHEEKCVCDIHIFEMRKTAS